MDGVMNDVVNYCNAASWKDCLICLLLQFLLKPHHQCGYPLVNIPKTTENHHVYWVNQLFLWPFSIAMLNYQSIFAMVMWMVVLTCFNHLEKYEFVNGKNDIPYMKWTIKHV